MARNKNSTALFDVIHAAKKPPKSSPSASIPAPRWWGKDKKPLKAAAADPTENVGKQQSWLTAAKKNAGIVPAAPSVSPVIQQPIEQQAAVDEPIESTGEPIADAPDMTPRAKISQPDTEPAPTQPKVRFIDRFKSRQAPAAAPLEEPDPAAEEQVEASADTDSPPLPVFYTEANKPEIKPQKRSAKVRDDREAMFAVDSASREFRLRLSYGGLIAIGFIVLMAMAIAFIAGTHAQLATDTTDVREPTGLVTPPSSTSGLMVAVSPGKPVDADRTIKPDVLSVSPRNPAPKPAVDSNAAPSAPLPIKASRDIGMMYVVIQSYPDQELAQKACDFVNHAGVPCTLVQGLTNWAPRDWYSVVGLQPFKKHDPSLDEYEKVITGLGVKFTSKIYNQFEPQGYTWRADSEQNEQ